MEAFFFFWGMGEVRPFFLAEWANFLSSLSPGQNTLGDPGLSPRPSFPQGHSFFFFRRGGLLQRVLS